MYRYVILPRVLVNVSVVDMSVTLLGNRIDFPIGISPTAMHYLAHHEGEKGTARGKEYPIGITLTASPSLPQLLLD